MACSYPITLVRNGRHELVPCGRCINCIQRKRAEWSFRLLIEHQNSKSAHFLTLTYNEENIPKNGQLDKENFKSTGNVSAHLKKILGTIVVGNTALKTAVRITMLLSLIAIVTLYWKNGQDPTEIVNKILELLQLLP